MRRSEDLRQMESMESVLSLAYPVSSQLEPFMKWPGGKRWFVDRFPQHFPPTFNRYIEPFLGGGSVYFAIRPSMALLSDINSQLISTYLAIKSEWRKVRYALTRHQERHSEEYYYWMREREPRSIVDCASRMIYLNRTCFNGIYRTNRFGKFNVPIGDRSDVLRESDDFLGLSRSLSGAEIRQSDFEAIVEEARRGDFVFADPPYALRDDTEGFTRYHERAFTWSDQLRLADALHRARARGAFVVCTNANHPSVRKLYRSACFRLHTVARRSAVSAAARSRGSFTELAVVGID